MQTPHLHMHMYTHANIHMCEHAHTCASTCTHLHAHSYMYIYIPHTNAHTRTQYAFTLKHIHTHLYMCTLKNHSCIFHVSYHSLKYYILFSYVLSSLSFSPDYNRSSVGPGTFVCLVHGGTPTPGTVAHRSCSINIWQPSE